MDILSRIKRLFARREPNASSNINEDEWFDLDLPIVSVTQDEGLLASIRARGEFDGQLIGITLDVLSEWDAKVTEDGPTFHWGQACYRSNGEESDRLLNILAKKYCQRHGNLRMVAETHVLAVGLADDPRQLHDQPVRMKCFFNSDSEDASAYAEVFTNIDLLSGVLQFHEKDQEYRAAIIRAFCGDA